MELRHLRYFVAVAEELHFGRAATRLSIEQSPLSQRIRDLELDLGVRLFHRTRRSTALTRAGERFLADTRRILTDLESSIGGVRSAAVSGEEDLRIGLAEGVAGAALGRFLRLCAAQAPLRPRLVERPQGELNRLLSAGGIDVVFTPARSGGEDLDCAPAWTEGLTLVSSAGLVRYSSLAKASEARWILPDPRLQPGMAEQVGALLQARGIAPFDPLIAASPHSLTLLAAAGLGVGLLSDSLANLADAVNLSPIHEPEARLTTWMIVRRDEPSPLVDRIRSMAAEAATPQRMP